MSEPRPCRLRFAGYGPQRRDCGGAVAVEFALVFMLFFLLFYAIVAYGLAFTLKQSVTMAAEEGARAAVQDAPNLATRINRAETMARGVLSWLPGGGITVSALEVPCPAGSATNETKCLKVEVNYDNAGHPIVPGLPLFGIAIPANLGATATVQFVQY